MTTRLAPLPIRVRPNLGEGTASYLRRLSTANHLPPSHLATIVFPSPTSHIDLNVLAQLTGHSAAALRRTLIDAPGRIDTEPGRNSFLPTAIDRRVTNLNDRIDLLVLLSEALHSGVHRHILHARYRLNRRLIRVALQHQQPRRFKHRTPDASPLFKEINKLILPE
ncbi:TniQ family protein [Streptomyces sp. NPDC088175]|uniref:TniQ family protein n=1 Tax=unclassified Streptomyces TaxID=2593676 RepID=UPI00382237E0